MPITPEQLKKELEAEKNMSLEEKMKRFPNEFCKCGSPLEETSGERYYADVKGKKVQVCIDCHYNGIGEEIDRTGYIGVPHAVGPRGQSNLD